MDRLVNYSSEEEDASYNKKADGPINRGSNGRYQERSSCGGYKDEAYERHSSSQRPSSSYQRDERRRDERYGSNSVHSKDNRDSRGVRGRDSRDFNNGHQRHQDSRSNHDRHRNGRDEYNRRETERPRIGERERDRDRERHNSRHSSNSTASNSYSHNNSRDKRSQHVRGGSGGNSNYDNSRSRHNQNQMNSTSRYDNERNERYERYTSTSTRFERNRQQQNSNKHTTRNRRSRSRSHSKDRRSPASSERSRSHSPLVNAASYEPEHHSPKREFNVDKSHQVEQTVRQIAPLMSLPISGSTAVPSKPNIAANSSSSGISTTISSSKNAEASTAPIQLPSYYNPSVINPTKYAEQVQKRKLLWGAKKTDNTAAKWGNAQFSQDTDGKVASKFMRLMGIKNSAGTTAAAGTGTTSGSDGEEKPKPTIDVKSREEMFSSMEQQYEVARQVTHTMRGVGLGFGSSRPY